MKQKTDFEAVTARGVTIRTFGSFEQARAYVASVKTEFPGMTVEEVTTTVTRRRAYAPRPALRLVAS